MPDNPYDAEHAAEQAIAAGKTHPEAKKAAMAVTEQRAKDIDKVARNALYAVCYLVRDGALHGSYEDLDDATWREVSERVMTIVKGEVSKASQRNFEAAYGRLVQAQEST